MKNVCDLLSEIIFVFNFIIPSFNRLIRVHLIILNEIVKCLNLERKSIKHNKSDT